VHQRVKLPFREQAVEKGAVSGVGFHQVPMEHRIPEATAEVVQRGDVATLACQVLDHVRAEIAGDTGDQDAKLS
jgi:hypothetical protein